MEKLNQFSSRYFSLILIGSCFLAFFIPDPGPYSSYLILFFLFIIIFGSFFKFELKKDIIKSNASIASLFIVLRFLIIPLSVYFLLKPISEFYAFGIFFLFLMPAAVSSPAFNTLFGAGLNLSILILVFSSFFSILTVSLLTPIVQPEGGEIGIGKLLITLLFSILLPFLLHLPFKDNSQFRASMGKNLPLLTVICLSLIFIIAISKNKDAILGDPAQLFIYFGISAVAYGFLYIAGWIIGWRGSLEQKLTFSVSSGMNNIGLAVSLAALYLAPEICIFFIVAEFAWVGILLPLRLIWRKVPEKLAFFGR